jgi:hypothetical protein
MLMKFIKLPFILIRIEATFLFILIGMSVALFSCESDGISVILDKPVHNRTISSKIVASTEAPPLSAHRFAAYYPDFDSLDRLSVKEIYMKGGDYKDEHIEFRVVVLDIDKDGLITQADEIYIAPVKSDSRVTVLSNHFTTGRQSFAFKCRNEVYKCRYPVNLQILR